MGPVTIMHPRLAFFFISLALALVLISNHVPPALAQENNAKKNAPHQGDKASGAADVARGKYLVESVAICGQCHTPRDGNGNLDRARWLQGAPVPWLPAKPDTD